ncbi:Tn7 transposase TnsA N-terminal domain-containing protein, partial [Leptospira sp. SA-E8]|uniref:Tn7 transposase TnsA N-terminal domain-containing protein n=1 Tax=Leptospira sp. SA-E8 TaxID=3422259 RepID=UPI003EBD70C2
MGIINCRWFQQHPIEYESQLEKRFVYSALLCPGIREIKSQPFTLPLAPGSYTPDFLLDYGDQMIVIEVKPSSKITKYIEVFDWASRFLQEFGIRFYVATEQGIDREDGACVSAAAEILRYAKSEVDGAIRRSVLTAFGQDEEVQLVELERRAAIPREVVMHLLALRWIALQAGSGIEDHAHVRIARYEPETALLEF